MPRVRVLTAVGVVLVVVGDGEVVRGEDVVVVEERGPTQMGFQLCSDWMWEIRLKLLPSKSSFSGPKSPLLVCPIVNVRRRFWSHTQSRRFSNKRIGYILSVGSAPNLTKAEACTLAVDLFVVSCIEELA